MKLKYITYLMIPAAISVVQAQNVKQLGISGLSTGRDGSRFFVNMTVDPKAINHALNNRLEIRPEIWSADSAHHIELPAVTVAGRNLYYATLRNGSPEETARLYRAGKGKAVNYSESVPYEAWMEQCSVGINGIQTGCCGVKKDATPYPVADVDLRPRTFSPTFSYVVPVEPKEKNFALSGRANIRFIVNRTNIDWSYANNYTELDSILKTVRAVKDNPDATVKSITLTGFASPEGPYDNNVRLAKGRVEVVKEYVRNNSSFPTNVYHTASVPEDWEGLKEWLKSSSLADRDKMIAFIDDPNIPVRTKNDEFMKRFPKDYPFILANVYPPLRHTDYRIEYNVRKYLNVDEIRQVMATRPGNLSQNEFYLLASSYPKGSAQYDEVFETAVRIFPDDPVANINAANSAMHRGDYVNAERYLLKAGDSAQADYGRGVLAALQKNYAKARTLFEKAEKGGVKEASEALEQIKLVTAHREGVTYVNHD